MLGIEIVWLQEGWPYFHIHNILISPPVGNLVYHCENGRVR